jgi:hypothetical protein
MKVRADEKNKKTVSGSLRMDGQSRSFVVQVVQVVEVVQVVVDEEWMGG